MVIILRYPTLITLDIYYWRPDYTNLLQQFLYQLEDTRPSYPKSHKFLLFWKNEIDAIISEVHLIENSNKINFTNFYQDL
jgi:uncharacterized protein Usg